jgi:hypothetical protein
VFVFCFVVMSDSDTDNEFAFVLSDSEGAELSGHATPMYNDSPVRVAGDSSSSSMIDDEPDPDPFEEELEFKSLSSDESVLPSPCRVASPSPSRSSTPAASPTPSPQPIVKKERRVRKKRRVKRKKASPSTSPSVERAKKRKLTRAAGAGSASSDSESLAAPSSPDLIVGVANPSASAAVAESVLPDWIPTQSFKRSAMQRSSAQASNTTSRSSSTAATTTTANHRSSTLSSDYRAKDSVVARALPLLPDPSTMPPLVPTPSPAASLQAFGEIRAWEQPVKNLKTLLDFKKLQVFILLFVRLLSHILSIFTHTNSLARYDFPTVLIIIFFLYS